MRNIAEIAENYVAACNALENAARTLTPNTTICIDREIRLHLEKYEDSYEVYRHFNIQERSKSTYTDGTSIVSGRTEQGLTVVCFCNSLPPTCKLVTVKKKVPKTSVVTLDDEFCEIEETKVVCGDKVHQ